MGKHDDLRQENVDHLARVLKRTGELKVFLAFTQTNKTDTAGWTSASRDARALAIICTMAELESLVKTCLQRTHEELNSAGIRTMALIPSVRQVVAHTAFESLRTLQDHSKMWERRSFTTTLDANVEVASFPIERSHPQPPLDGKTLKPEHFFRLWQIYQLPGSPFPNPRWPGALQKLALARNDLAHGNLPYHEIFQQAGRAVPNIESYVNDVSDFAAHFVATWNTYLENEAYIVQPTI
ncbi:HEPN domain-containing protein [Streptomyces griseorubiginosus]|uniref:HEPN domain-containing protein n=1 Tax=Streptomyces griseorubiginosus TaxID=67304 RepID=UPI0036EFD6B3